VGKPLVDLDEESINIHSSLSERVAKTTSIEKKTMDIEERGVRLRLTIVDTPGEKCCRIIYFLSNKLAHSEYSLVDTLS